MSVFFRSKACFINFHAIMQKIKDTHVPSKLPFFFYKFFVFLKFFVFPQCTCDCIINSHCSSGAECGVRQVRFSCKQERFDFERASSTVFPSQHKSSQRYILVHLKYFWLNNLFQQLAILMESAKLNIGQKEKKVV